MTNPPAFGNSAIFTRTLSGRGPFCEVSPMKVAIHTLGCKVNQYETQAMEAELTGRGHALVPFDGAADAM